MLTMHLTLKCNVTKLNTIVFIERLVLESAKVRTSLAKDNITIDSM